MAKKTEEQIKKVESKPLKTKVSSTSVEKNKTAVSKKVNSKSIKTTKSSTSKKVAPKNATKKSTSSKSTVKKSKIKKVESNIVEYYDLPYKYNQTIVKILAQTPRTLFVYWEISDEDREKYVKIYGSDFFNKSVPVLIVTNTSKNYSFEIQINDFANSWYFNIDDEHCKYTVELGRRPINNLELPNNYLYVASSNNIEVPNGHILFDMKNSICFKNTKTNEMYTKDITNMKFMKYLNKIYKANTMYALYKNIYINENIFDINNPTSSFNK